MFLSRLDRKLRALLPSPEISRLLGDKAAAALFDKGVLRTVDSPDTGKCPEQGHDGDGIIPIERQGDGSYSGFCPEHRRRVVIAAADAAWVEFDPIKWSAAVKSRNGLEGDPSIDTSGRAFLGVLKTRNKKAGLVAEAPGAVGLAGAHKPPGADGAPLIFVALGESTPTAGRDAGIVRLSASEAFEDDLLTLRTQAIGDAMASLPGAVPAGTRLAWYSDREKGPLPLSDREYERLLSPTALKKTDLVIDRTHDRAWRDGREILRMKQNGKKLSPTGLQLVAHYMKCPGRALKPIDAPPYCRREGDSRVPTSAMVMLANMRVTLRLEAVLKTGNNPSGSPGGSFYAFEPPRSFSYVLIVSAEEA